MTAQDRFIITYSQFFSGSKEIQILVDRETGVNYLFNISYNAGGLTPLLDKDGKPIVTPLK